MDDYSNYRFVKKVTDLSQVQYNNHLIETETNISKLIAYLTNLA